MSRMKPNITVSGPSKGGILSWLCIRSILLLNHAQPFRVTPENPVTFDSFDGLLLTGGHDIHPKRYGQEPRISQIYDEERDRMELELIEHALNKGIPILGICRGIQMLNTYFNGTLYQDLGSVFDDFIPFAFNPGQVLARHAIEIENQSELYTIIGKKTCYVNSLHHQGIDRLGEQLNVTAWSPNGVIQAVESQGSSWVLGLQWHPEFMLHNKRQRQIFSAFVKQC